jgi:hypothetical protein
MERGRPRLLKLPRHFLDTAQQIEAGLRQWDGELGEYPTIFRSGTPLQIKEACRRLGERGFGVFREQYDLENPHTLASLILKGRNDSHFPKVRRDAQIKFLARFAATGKYVSDKTWKRTASLAVDDATEQVPTGIAWKSDQF